LTSTLDHLADAKAALSALSGVTVRLRGEKYPKATSSLIVLDRIVSTPIGNYERDADQIVIQVNSFAPSTEQSLELDTRARDALDAAGFLWQTSRATPTAEGDALSGTTTDYTR
jgi:hypothetical protein